MHAINHQTITVAAVVEQQNSATTYLSQNVARAAQSTGHMVTVLVKVAGSATNARFAGIVRKASQAVESAIGDFRCRPSSPYAWLAAVLPSAACAAASRAIGTRNGEHDT